MSNFTPASFRLVQLQQPVRRIDPDSAGRRVDFTADVLGQWNQDFSSRTLHHQAAPADTAVNPTNDPDLVAPHRFHHTADELMLVISTGRQRLQRSLRYPQFLSSQSSRRVDARKAFEAHDRAAVLYAHGADGQLLIVATRSRPHRCPDVKSLRQEIGFRVDDDVAP